MKTISRYSAVLVISVLILSGSVSLFMPSVVAQSYGNSATFSRGGMQIVYSISGAVVTNSSSSGSQLEGGGSATALALVGTIQAGATITVSGTFVADNTAYSDNAGSVTIRAGSATNTTGSLPVPPSTSLPFSLSLTLPTDAQSADISIGQGSNDASWGFGVSGSFTVQAAVDHITIVSPYDNVLTGAAPFTIRANVYGIGNSAVPDGTPVTFTLTDEQRGDLAGASIGQTAYTSNSAVTVTFSPPGDSYWADSLHSSFSGQNYVMITATAGGVQGSKTIDINQAATSNPTPITPEFPSVIIVSIVLILMALAISVFKRKTLKFTANNQPTTEIYLE